MSSKAWIAVTGIAVVMGLGGCGTLSPYFPAQVGYSDTRNGVREDDLGANDQESSPKLGVTFHHHF